MAFRVGCVSFLNTAPLIDGLDREDRLQLVPAVPARLPDMLAAGEVDCALCPVIDYHRLALDPVILPVGGIACDGPTLTVRLFSRLPIDRIQAVHTDTDSHTSVALLRVVLHDLYRIEPALHPLDPSATSDQPGAVEAMLLIGDKVVTRSPRAVLYPYQLDLGEAWKQLTGLPFAFAVWMAGAGTDLGDLPEILQEARLRNARRIDVIATERAPRHGWPVDLAKQYLGQTLRYDIGPRELEAMRRFADRAAALDLIDHARPLRLHGGQR